MGLEVKALVAALSGGVKFLERRSPLDRLDYIEGVLSRQDLKACHDLLSQQFGSMAKDFGAPAKFDKPTSKILEKIGGIWTDQCLFFLRVDGLTAVYAALWPWQSDASKITLKAGAIRV